MQQDITNLHPTTLGKRAGSLIIDLLFYCIVVWLFGHLMLSLGDKSGDLSIILVMFFLYPVTVLICWLVGNTPGKKIIGLRIADEKSGETPSFGQYLLRSIPFIFLFSLNIVLVIPVLVTKKNKAFHDMIAGTIVVDV